MDQSGAYFGRPAARARDVENLGDWAPAIDVLETDTEYVVKADLPALTREHVRVGIEDGVLTIEGERKPEAEEAHAHYHRLERAYGMFVRRLTVPAEVDERQVTATFKDGVLTLRLPKSEQQRPRAVKVDVA